MLRIHQYTATLAIQELTFVDGRRQPRDGAHVYYRHVSNEVCCDDLDAAEAMQIVMKMKALA